MEDERYKVAFLIQNILELILKKVKYCVEKANQYGIGGSSLREYLNKRDNFYTI